MIDYTIISLSVLISTLQIETQGYLEMNYFPLSLFWPSERLVTYMHNWNHDIFEAEGG